MTTAHHVPAALTLSDRRRRGLDHDIAQEVGDDGRRWAPRSTLLVGGAVSLALWGVIGLAVAALH